MSTPRCCSRFCHELSRSGVSGFFDLNENDSKAVDPGPTFGPHGLLQLAWRIAVLVFVVVALIYDVSTALKPELTFAYLTNFTYLVSCVYLVFSLLCSIVEATSWGLRVDKTSIRLHERATWFLFAVVMPGEVLVAVLYWVLVHDPETTADFFNYLSHGAIVPLVAIDGWVVGRIPLRAPQGLFVLLYAAGYAIWTIIYMHINTAEGGNDDDYEALYDFILWKDSPSTTAPVVLVLLFIICPFLFMLCWALSTLVPKRYRKYSSPGEEDALLSP